MPKKKRYEKLPTEKPEVFPCHGMDHVMFGPPLVYEDENGSLVEYDKRADPDVELREAVARGICATCSWRIKCLERAIVMERRGSLRTIYGVWGGMGEAERRAFHAHLCEEGYIDEVPTGGELIASIREFYKKRLKGIDQAS